MKKITFLISIFSIVFCYKNTDASTESSNLKAFKLDTLPKKVLSLDEFIKSESNNLIELDNPITLPDSIKINVNTKAKIHANKKEVEHYFLCTNGSPKSANFLTYGNGGKLYIKFTDARWGRYNNWNIRNTCGNFWPSNRKFTFPDPRAYQYQMILLEVAPGITRYYVNICQEDVTYYVNTKKGFEYYVYTNDTRGDHDDNRGYISYCFGLK